VLFIGLDNVNWHHLDPIPEPRDENPKRWGTFEAILGATQVEFVKNVLAHHPLGDLVVLFSHIPLKMELGGDTADRQALYEVLKGQRVLAISGHVHGQQHNWIGPADGFQSDWELHQVICTAGCGGFFKGWKDERGIPNAICPDGVENGYNLLHINGNEYSLDYKAAGKPWDWQMRLLLTKDPNQPQTRLCANVFNGSFRSKVSCSLNGLDWVTMEREIGPDPLISNIWENRTPEEDNILVWPEAQNPHLWYFTLPADLAPGIHRVVVRHEDYSGRINTNALIFESPLP
jgi:hypothetical protein